MSFKKVKQEKNNLKWRLCILTKKLAERGLILSCLAGLTISKPVISIKNINNLLFFFRKKYLFI